MIGVKRKVPAMVLGVEPCLIDQVEQLRRYSSSVDVWLLFDVICSQQRRTLATCSSHYLDYDKKKNKYLKNMINPRQMKDMNIIGEVKNVVSNPSDFHKTAQFEAQFLGKVSIKASPLYSGRIKSFFFFLSFATC